MENEIIEPTVQLKKKSIYEFENDLINEVLLQFDFVKCQVVMDYLGWKWYRDGGYISPSIDELKESAKDRLRKAIAGCKDPKIKSDQKYFVSSGGLRGSAYKNRYGHITGVSLEFILTEWEVDYDV